MPRQFRHTALLRSLIANPTRSAAHLLREGRALRQGDVQQHARVAHGNGPRDAARLARHHAHRCTALRDDGDVGRLVVLVPVPIGVLQGFRVMS